jgi:hypothetical protein
VTLRERARRATESTGNSETVLQFIFHPANGLTPQSRGHLPLRPRLFSVQIKYSGAYPPLKPRQLRTTRCRYSFVLGFDPAGGLRRGVS